MAVETLKDLESIGGFKVIRKKPETMSWDDFDKLRDDYPINITDKMNCISFKIQNGPIKENGVNGCQVDTLIETARIMIEKLNKNFPCYHNEQALYHLQSALDVLEQRKTDRTKRGVEGLNKV